MKGRVVIIEDELELGELIQLYLDKEGIDGRLCASAEEGLETFRRDGADLIVLDINLPGMDGFEFLQVLRRESSVPVIIVSARQSDEDIVMGLGIGADEFVTKPFAPRVLAARIRAMLRRSRTSGSKQRHDASATETWIFTLKRKAATGSLPSHALSTGCGNA